jgi:hypothetical protein
MEVNLSKRILFAIASALLGVVLLLGCSQSQGDGVSFRILYTYQTEVNYERVEIIEDKLYYTYFDDFQGKCVGWEEQNPCWTESDLAKRETVLTPEEVEQLKQTVRDINFFQMESTYGSASAEQRFYPEALYVKIGGEKKEVIYQNFPEAAPKPAAFEELVYQIYMIIVDRF